MQKNSVNQKVITDDLDALLDALPPHISNPIKQFEDRMNLLEVVMDLGRAPQARFPGREANLSTVEITEEDIEYLVSRIGEFGGDNRAGIERTLHRISAIRNRRGRIVGVTCRVGRAVFGTIGIISDIVESGKSILLLGRPGVGKTTMLREVARVLADDFHKRVVIVDTSNEIAGDGDIPHPAIGNARRMQVPTPTLQHAVMIEAVENHMPEVIIIDEIGTELEAAAARTIAERGVQLVGTAHGNTLENLMLNPTLSDLVGGIQTVTLGDEEARRRGTQKSILERKAPPTFDVIVEIQRWEKVAVHENVATVVDSILRGNAIPAQIRYIDEEGEVKTASAQPTPTEPERLPVRRSAVATRVARLFPYGISVNRLEQAIKELRVPATLTKDLRSADAVLTLKNYYKKKTAPVKEAEAAGIPVYVLKTNNILQMEQILASIYDLDVIEDPATAALRETEEAISQVLSRSEPMELTPQNAYIRRLQHQMAEKYHLNSRSEGKEPYRRVKIYKE
ncbi:MAG: AAA family ATPase [Actinobacteria bacterium]|nr:AAA family ATPase [Actinomycetota bacterium]